MKVHLFIIALLLGVVFTQASGGPCIGCNLAVSMLQKVAMHKQISLTQAGEFWCNALGNKLSILSSICSGMMSYMIPLIEPDFGSRTPDYTCSQTLDVCKGETQCKLWQNTEEFLDGAEPILSSTASELPNYRFDSSRQEFTYFFEWLSMVLTRWVEPTEEFTAIDPVDIYYKLHRHFRTASPSILKLDSFTRYDDEFASMGVSQLTAWYHHPMIGDDDKDSFATFPKLRGSDWRGADCDDKDAAVYPGRIDTSTTKDQNCNGIYGVEKTTNKSYEELFCRNVKQYGIAVLGDSSQAHFSIPPHWLDPQRVQIGTYDKILDTIMNELDFPTCSTVTGTDEKSCPSYAEATIKPEFASIYMRNRKRNLCANNDYQNIAVNGARSSSMKPGGIVDSFARGQKTDHPMIVFINLIGNDVCNKNSDPSSMSQPDQFRKDTLETLHYLDTVLPNGSHVILGSLVDGTVLYDTMGHRKHPLGFTYRDFYNYLNCYNTSPCAGWMNESEAVRRATTGHAIKLNRESELIAKNVQSFNNFKVHYLPLLELFTGIAQVYPKPVELIEPNDGFHPSSVAQMLLSDAIWDYMENKLKIVIPTNPNNDAIRSVFGL